MTPDEARARFADASVAHLATVGADGAPHIVPITFAVAGDVIYTATDAKPKRGGVAAPVRERRGQPAGLACLSTPTTPTGLACGGLGRTDAASIVADGAELELALLALRARYSQYATVALTGPAMVIESSAGAAGRRA